MSHERTSTFTGATLGLSAITLTLVVLGFFLVRRLSGDGDIPPVEIRPLPSTEQADVTPDGPSEEFLQPQVLTAEESERIEGPTHVAERPRWLSTQDGGTDWTIPELADPFVPASPDVGDSLWNDQHSDGDRYPAERSQLR